MSDFNKNLIIHGEDFRNIPRKDVSKWLEAAWVYVMYGEDSEFESWSESALWDKIKARIDQDQSKYLKKISNLKQNKGSTDSTPNRDRIDTESDTESDPNRAPKNDFRKCISISKSISNDISSQKEISKGDVFIDSLGVKLTSKQTEAVMNNINIIDQRYTYDFLKFLTEEIRDNYKSKPKNEQNKILISILTKGDLSTYKSTFLDKLNRQKEAARTREKLDIYNHCPFTICRDCGGGLTRRNDFDGNIKYTAYMCEPCNLMYTCEDMEWKVTEMATGFKNVLKFMEV